MWIFFVKYIIYNIKYLRMNISFRMITQNRPRIPVSYIIQQFQEHSRKQEPSPVTSEEPDIIVISEEPEHVSVVEEPEPVIVPNEESLVKENVSS
jgi:hypothetical protein